MRPRVEHTGDDRQGDGGGKLGVAEGLAYGLGARVDQEAQYGPHHEEDQQGAQQGQNQVESGGETQRHDAARVGVSGQVGIAQLSLSR